MRSAELKALKGMEEYLNKVDYLYTEVNSNYVYVDCALITELDEYLKKFGLIRVENRNARYNILLRIKRVYHVTQYEFCYIEINMVYLHLQ